MSFSLTQIVSFLYVVSRAACIVVGAVDSSALFEHRPQYVLSLFPRFGVYSPRSACGCFLLSHATVPLVHLACVCFCVLFFRFICSFVPLFSFVTGGGGGRGRLQAVVQNVPPPPGPTGGPLRALIYDSVYDEYKVSPPHDEQQQQLTVTVAVNPPRLASCFFCFYLYVSFMFLFFFV